VSVTNRSEGSRLPEEAHITTIIQGLITFFLIGSAFLLDRYLMPSDEIFSIVAMVAPFLSILLVYFFITRRRESYIVDFIYRKLQLDFGLRESLLKEQKGYFIEHIKICKGMNREDLAEYYERKLFSVMEKLEKLQLEKEDTLREMLGHKS